MTLKNYSIPLILVCFLPGCASLDKSILLGAGIGAAGGGTTGMAIKRTPTNLALGVVIGSILGGIAGAIFHTKPSEENLAPPDPTFSPQLTMPTFRCFTVESKITGDTIEQPHTRCVIDRKAGWTK